MLALEKECGAKPLVRTNQKVCPTVEGRILFEEAVNIIEAHDRSLRRISAVKKNPPITLGGLYLNAHVLERISTVLERAKKAGEPLIVTYSSDAMRPYAEMVADGEIDVAFTMQNFHAPIPAHVETLRLFDDPLVAIVHEAHPFAQRESISLADMDNIRMLAPTGAHSIAGEQVVRALLRGHGAQPLYMPVFLRSIQDFPTLDIADNVLILEESILRQQTIDAHYKIVPFSDADAHFSFYALFNRNAKSKSVATFKTLLESVVEEHRETVCEA